MKERKAFNVVQVAGAAGDRLRESADDILTELRPRLETAAKSVRAAAVLGIGPRTVAADVIALDTPKAVTAWRTLAPSITELEMIGDARVVMTGVVEVDPDPTATWLRRSEHRCLSLLSTHKTTEAVKATRTPPSMR